MCNTSLCRYWYIMNAVYGTWHHLRTVITARHLRCYVSVRLWGLFSFRSSRGSRILDDICFVDSHQRQSQFLILDKCFSAWFRPWKQVCIPYDFCTTPWFYFVLLPLAVWFSSNTKAPVRYGKQSCLNSLDFIVNLEDDKNHCIKGINTCI